MTYDTSIPFDLDGAEILPFPSYPVEPAEQSLLLASQSDTMARMLAYLKALPASPSAINDAVDGLFDEIIAGQGGDFILEVGPSSIFARHKDFSYPGPSAPYTGDVHSGLLLTANGIAMGYNKPADGEFIPAVAISSTGDISILGTLTAGSVIATTVTFGSGGPTASTVASNASTGASHAGVTNSNPHGTSLDQIAGDLDDILDGSTFFKTTANQADGATRAYNALDGGYNYIRAISTQKIIVSEANPTNGVVFDTNGLRGYSGGDIKFNINTTGTVWFAGDISAATGTFSGNINTGGFLKATGGFDVGGFDSAFISMPASSDDMAYYGYGTTSSIPLVLFTQLGTGQALQASNNSASQPTVGFYNNNSSGTAVFGQGGTGGTGVSGVSTSGYGVVGSGAYGVTGSGLIAGEFSGTIRGLSVLSAQEGIRVDPGSGFAAINILDGYILRPYSTTGKLTVYDQTFPHAAIGTYLYQFHT